MTEKYDENKPLYGSRGIAIYLKLLKSRYSHVDTDEVLRYAGMEPYQVTDDGHLFSQKQVNLFQEKIVELTGNPAISREAGRYASSAEALGTMKGSVIGLMGPLRYYEMIGSLANKISKASHYAARKLAHNKVEIIVTPYPGTIEQPFQCQNRMGYWEAASTIFSLKPPHIEHPRCLFKGDSVCHYIVSWKDSPVFILKRVRNITALVLSLACLATIIISPGLVPAAAVSLSVLTVLTLNALARTFEIRDLHRTIESLREASDELVEQIEINYENSLLINEIGQTLAKESEVEGLFSKVVNILHKRLNYDHCLVLSANKDKTRLNYQADRGFTEMQSKIVKNITFKLDGTLSEELFTGVFSNKKPILLNNIEAAKERVSSRSYNFLKRIDSRSLICCPIVYENESLGILTVSNAESKKSLLQRDINMLMGITSQIASRMHNMRLETHMRQHQKMEAVGILAGGVAHDFNNILTTILGYSELIASRLAENDPIKDMVQDIYHAGERAAGLTRQLLAFSRKQIMEMKVTNLNTIVNDMGKMLKRLIGEDLSLVINTAESIGNIKADVGQIEQILMNLAVNARDAMPCGGSLTIETGEIFLDEKYVEAHEELEIGNYALLTVADTGEGMSKDVQDKIFEPFFSTKERGKGTGLGLSTVYGIVKQHHGHIYVYSEKGKGTTFKIYFPVVSIQVEKKAFVKSDTMPQGKETILIVDDDSSIRKLLVDTLEPLGYNLLSAACGEEALEICRSSKEKIDLLLSDVIMTGMNGRELSEIARQEFPKIKTVLMSGYTDDVVAQSGVLDPGINFINKPLLPVSLANEIRAVLDGEDKKMPR